MHRAQLFRRCFARKKQRARNGLPKLRRAVFVSGDRVAVCPAGERIV